MVVDKAELETAIADAVKVEKGNYTDASWNAFADGGKTSSWAVDGVAWCVKAGIIQGMNDVTLSPNTNVSRAQVAVMLQRFIDLVK